MKHFTGRRLLMATCLFFALVVAPGAWAQTTYFEPLSSSQARVSLPAAQNIQKYVAYQLKESDLRGYLAKAPLEFSGRGTGLSLAIPLPNGTVETFLMSESPILAPAIAARHPEIKTYSGTGTTHKNYSIRVSFTSGGFDAIILGVGGDAIYYTKASADRVSRVYLTYFAHDVKKPENTKSTGSAGKCGSIDPAIPGVSGTEGGRKGASLNNTGTTLRTFRLAIATTSKFTEKRGGTVTAAYNSVVGYVNRMNAVYRTELSVAFVLVSDTKIIYGGSNGDVNPNADPYTNNDTGKSSDENQINLDKEIGTANYDVGHVLGYSGGSGEGVAVTPSVCINDRKANGTSNVGNTSYGTIDSGTQYAPVFDDQLLCHEIGHQFGMSHSFHSSIPVCTTRAPATSVEPGAGTTIMSYGYTCSGSTGNDDYEAPYQPFLNFHTANYTQAVNYINTLTCFVATTLTNAVPVIGAFPVATTIPRSTPFALTGAATDADADNTLNYSWEGTNIGLFIPNPTTLDNTRFPPFFRSYPPVSTGTRTFPRLSAILDGTNKAKGDKLPSEGIATTHRLTVRDNVGGLTYQEVTVTIDGESGPFLVTNDPSGSLPGGSKQTINWDVANTTAAPVSCANVDILLSTDGGLTFPTTLLANTPNDGNQSVTLPEVLTSTARIKIAGSNTIFFDISNANFSIVAPAVPVVSLTAPDANASEATANPGQSTVVMVAKNGAGRLAAPGVDPASLHFERSNTVGTLVVKYSLGGTATNGNDYVGLPGSLTFADGESTVDVPVTPIDDEEVEGDEDVVVTLVDEAAYDPDPTNTSSKITIKEDDVAPLSITAVTTVSCTTLTAGLRRVSFTPRYAGLTGQPVSFSVANELVPTTNPGPYTLELYTDNPAITLRAVQQGTAGEASFVYNWLAACGAPVVVVVVPPVIVVPPVMSPLSITGVTTVSCTTLTAGLRQVSFSPQYAGANGQPITFSVANELSATTSAGPYTLNLYTDNPAITLKATQTGTTGEASFVYNWLAACGAPVVVVPPVVVPPTVVPFAIAGVTTVSCQTVRADLRQVSFSPQYEGVNGQPISFSVVNELVPTTAAGPYTLNLYTDNPTITLKAVQQGTAGEVSFAYNWLTACTASASTRIGVSASAESVLTVRVLGNPAQNGQVRVEVRGAGGQPLRIQLTDMRGQVIGSHVVEQAGSVEQRSFELGRQAPGLLLLRASTPTQSQTLKVLRD